MKQTITIILVTICLVSISCQVMNATEKGPMRTLHEISETLPDLKIGMSLERCINLLGKPTFQRKEFAKERPQHIGTSLYYVVKMASSNLDPFTDSYLQLAFDRHGVLLSVSPFNLEAKSKRGQS